MSTRCMIHFHWGNEKKPESIIYRHSDGYPGTPDGKNYGVLVDLQQFFADVEKQCKDTMYGTRFDDPEYLAAKFVVWQAGEVHQYAGGGRVGDIGRKEFNDKGPLNFGGIGVAIADHCDIEYRYHVHCGEYDERGRPKVTWEEVGFLEEEDVDDGPSIDEESLGELRSLYREMGTKMSRLGLLLDSFDTRAGEMPGDAGPGTYRVLIEPPTTGAFKDMTSFTAHCNHPIHAINKANKRGLVVREVERIGD